MCVASTAKRRRRQAKMGYTHLAKKGRPIYGKRSAEKLDTRLARVIREERLRAQRKGGKK